MGAFLSLSHRAACGRPHSWLLSGLRSAPVTGLSHLPSGSSSSFCPRVCDGPSVCSCLGLCSLSLFRGRATVQGLATGHLVPADAQTHVSMAAMSHITAAAPPSRRARTPNPHPSEGHGPEALIPDASFPPSSPVSGLQLKQQTFSRKQRFLIPALLTFGACSFILWGLSCAYRTAPPASTHPTRGQEHVPTPVLRTKNVSRPRQMSSAWWHQRARK